MTGTTPASSDDGAAARAVSRVQFVVEHVKAAILRGEVAAGDRLPPEHEIARRLGVSRTPVREAVKVLQSAGIVEIRRGSGTFVAAGASAALAQLVLFQSYLRDATPQKLMEVRWMVERTGAELAALNRTEDDLAAMRAAINRLAALGDAPGAPVEDLLRADLAFHHAVFAACKNELIATLANFVLCLVEPWIARSLEVGGARNAARNHEVVLAMIATRNAGGARECVQPSQVALGLDYWRRSLEQ